MNATGPFAYVLSEMAALLEVVDGAVVTVVEEEDEPDDVGVEEEEVGKELVVAVVPRIERSGVEELPETASEAEVIDSDGIETGPGPPILNLRINKKDFYK